MFKVFEILLVAVISVVFAEIKTDADTVLKKDSAIVANKISKDSINLVKYGKINVISIPAGASLIVDDSKVGKTPIIIDSLEYGKHLIELRKSGYFLKKAYIIISEEDTKNIKFNLVKPVELLVKSTPSGATVSINGKAVGTTPYVTKKIKPNDYNVLIELDNYISEKRIISLTNKNKDSVIVKLDAIASNSQEKNINVVEKKEVSKKSIVNKISLVLFFAFSIGIIIAELSSSN